MNKAPLTDDDLQRFGACVRLVSRNPDMADLHSRGLWLLQELQGRGYAIVRIQDPDAAKKLCEADAGSERRGGDGG